MSSARSGFVWSLAERYLSLGVSLTSTFILARLLTPTEVGLFSLCAAAISVAGTLREFGVTDYIVQEKQLTTDKLRGAFAVALITSWGTGLIVYLARHQLSAYYKDPAIASLLEIMCVGFVILPLASTSYALMNRDMSFRKIFLIQLAATSAQSATSVLLAWQGAGAASLAWGTVASIAAQAVLVVVLGERSLPLPLLRGAAPIFRFGALQMASRIMDTLTSSAHEFIIARQFGFTSLGFFSRAKTLVDMFHVNVAAAFNRVATPSLARAHRENESLVHRFGHGTAIFTSVAWPFFMFLAMAAPEIIRTLYGGQWERSHGIATWLALGMLPTALFTMSSVVMSALGAVERRLVISLQWCPVHLLGLLIAAHWGFEAMAIAWLATNSLIAWLFARQMRVLLGATWLELFGASGASVVLAVVTASVQWLTLEALRMRGLPSWIPLLISLTVGVLAWTLTVRWLRHPVFAEVVRVARRLGIRLPATA